MNWTVEKLTEELTKLSASKGDVFDAPVKINKRLSTTHGRVCWRETMTGIIIESIDFSYKLLNESTYDGVMEVVVHEWCHYYLTKTTKVSHGHDQYFKNLAIEMGISGATKGRPELTEEAKANLDKSFKYSIFCNRCGEFIGGYARKCTVVNNPDSVRSNCCRSTVSITQNW